MRDIQGLYQEWREKTGAVDLEEMRPAEIEDAFYRDLNFGTGGLRGVLGSGTNRMNLHTVTRATQGLAQYLLKKERLDLKVAIGYDSRIMSEEFSRLAAEVLSSHGIEVYRYEQLMPTPCLSYAVRVLGCEAGIMITASHNPAEYNGFKVYGEDGCQITTDAAASILEEISGIPYFSHNLSSQDTLIHTIDESIITSYMEDVKRQSFLDKQVNRDLSIVYTPLHGTGLMPVTRVLEESGYSQVHVVEAQAVADGNFPTCPEPNPEYEESFRMALDLALDVHADLVFATDPDCDRLGVAVKHGDQYQLLTGNEVGILLLDFICQHAHRENAVAIKTIVTTDLARKITDHYGVELLDVLTGFKYIGEQIGVMEAKGEENRFLFGFEESNGYLVGTYVRDKDAVVASLLVADLYAYYAQQGKSIISRLEEIYEHFGYTLNTLYSYEFKGASGFAKMQEIIERFRREDLAFADLESMEDYLGGIHDLPSSDVLKFYFADESTAVLRPSGTEPKLKLYLSVSRENEDSARLAEKKLHERFVEYMNVEHA